MSVIPKTWAYGVTTVPQRKTGLLLKTIESLRSAGFPSPRLFVDGCPDPREYHHFGLEVVTRYPQIRAYGNWYLALCELYFRSPTADRFAIFQDDIALYRNLRTYLDWCPFPGELNTRPKGYWNLYTFPHNQLLSGGKTGWYPSDQMGKGALALIFNREGVRFLLSNSHMIDRVQNPHRGYKSIDGAVVEAMKNAGWKEYVHNPSLVQHLGDVSTIGSLKHPKANSFLGEDFDAGSLIR